MDSSSLRLGDRSLFPTLEARAYLAHASLSPPSSPVLAAVHRCLEISARHGMRGAREVAEGRAEVRARAAQLLHCTPEDLGFIPNTSAGVIAIARSIRFRPGDRVIVFDGEFPANVTPWRLVAEEQNLSLVYVPLAPFARSDEEGLEALRAELAQGARVVAVSAVQFQTGLRMPLAAMAELCHAHGAELFVDAIQALGAVPLDVSATGVDYLATGSHKFLMGLEGSGLLFVSKQALSGLSLGLSGWTNHEDAFGFLVRGPGELHYDRPLVRSARFVEQGTMNAAGIAALGASLELLLGLGVDRIFAHVNAYLDRLEPELVALGCESVRAPEPERRSASLSVKLPPGRVLSEVAHKLSAQGIAVATPDGYLRFSPHFPNALEEIPHVAAALKSALA